jgi:hypothetical protein
VSAGARCGKGLRTPPPAAPPLELTAPSPPSPAPLLPRRFAAAGPLGKLALNASCGGVAGALALGTIYPFEFVNIRMAAATSHHQFGQSERAR